MKLDQPVELRMKRVGYICGETSSRNLQPGQKPHTLPMPGGAITYTKNLHLPFEKAPGHVEEVTLVEGQTLTLFNGRRLEIPSLPKGWAGLGDEFTTCRNFQFCRSLFRILGADSSGGEQCRVNETGSFSLGPSRLPITSLNSTR